MNADPSNIANLVQAAEPSTAIAIVGELVPILAIVMGVGIGMLSLYFNFRNKREMFQLYHAERMAAIEKGIELPPLPQEYFTNYKNPESAAARNRRRGLVLLFLGIAITIAMIGVGNRNAWWGLVPAALGAAYLLSSRFEAAELRKTPGDGEPPVLR